MGGSFPYVEGTINSVDASSGTINVQDLLTKKPVQIKITENFWIRDLVEISGVLCLYNRCVYSCPGPYTAIHRASNALTMSLDTWSKKVDETVACNGFANA